jgi:hypothetical protein
MRRVSTLVVRGVVLLTVTVALSGSAYAFPPREGWQPKNPILKIIKQLAAKLTTFGDGLIIPTP